MRKCSQHIEMPTAQNLPYIECKMTILRQLDTKKGVIHVLLDLSAEFDTIDHDHLFELLQNRFGIKGTALDWIKSYLGNRSSSIHINSKTSPHGRSYYRGRRGSRLVCFWPDHGYIPQKTAGQGHFGHFWSLRLV